MYKENIKNLTDSIYISFTENDINKIEDILKDIDKYDYINIKTSNNILDYINRKNINICVINLSDNEYFCSSKYCLVKDKLYKYDKIELTTHSGDSYISYSFIATNKDFFIKFCSKRDLLEFYYESVEEVKFLDKYKDYKIDFIDRQKIYDYDINDKYVISVRKLVDSDFLSKKLISEIDDSKKLFIIEEIIKQLVFLENEEIVYNDVNCANVMFDGVNTTLIDLGSYQRCPDKIKYLYDFNRLYSFNVYDLTIIFIYNLFNIFNDYIYETKFSQETIDKIVNIYNYNPNIVSLITEILRLRYRNSCSFRGILNIVEKFRKNKNKLNHIKKKNVIISNNDNINYVDIICSIKKQEINSVVDIKYFSCNSIQTKNKEIKYIQICQNDKLITKNRLNFNNYTNQIFLKLDVLKEPLPNADIIFCIDLFENLTNDQIWIILENIKHSKSKYFAFSHYFDNDKNINKDSRKSLNKYVNLTMSPFNFPAPYFVIPSVDNNNYIAVYDIEEVGFFMKYHDEFMSNIRLNLYRFLKDKLIKLVDVFSKYDNGFNLLKEALFAADSLDWDILYYNKKYKDIVDNNDIFIEYINLLLLTHKKDMERVKKDNKNESFFEALSEDNYSQFSLITKEFVIWQLNKMNI